ncbi:hypothetical protein OHD60_31870 [Escherichia coli]|nr:hypothetical protein [Escherichia coli]
MIQQEKPSGTRNFSSLFEFGAVFSGTRSFRDNKPGAGSILAVTTCVDEEQKRVVFRQIRSGVNYNSHCPDSNLADDHLRTKAKTLITDI